MAIIALDISTRSTGWFIDKRRWGTIRPDEDLIFPQKLVFFRRELEKLLKKYKLETAVVEDAYYTPKFGNIHTLKTLVKFAGVAIELCESLGIKTEIITATQARKYCCGKGKMDKKMVFEYFKDKYKVDFTFSQHNDITDAMALLAGYHGMQKSKKKS